MPFTCTYCGQTFCSEHRLPEKHQCPALPQLKRNTWIQTNYKPTRESEARQPTSRKTASYNPPKINSLANDLRRKLRNTFPRYRTNNIKRRLRKTTETLIELGILVILSLPIYLTYLIDAMVSQDPLTGVLFQNLIDKNVLFPTGVYAVSVLYLIYRKFSRKRLRFEWVLVLSASLFATWSINRFLTTMGAISMIFTSQTPQMPNLLEYYRIWILMILNIAKDSLILAENYLRQLYTTL